MKSCLVGVLSWCDSDRFPERFKIFKKCVRSIEKYIPKEHCIRAVVDNNSSEDVKRFIKSTSVFDIKILLPENIHDTGGLAVLAKICKDMALKYFFPIDNDHVFFRKGFLQPCLYMLERHPECGYVRLLKFKYNKRDFYDKAKKGLKGHNEANEIWMYNLVTRKSLSWEGPIKDKFSFYINNWHWATCGPLTKLSVWEKIFPKKEGLMPIYYDSENAMRRQYQKLNLKTLVLNGGAFAQEDVSVYQSTFRIFAGTLIYNFFNNLTKKNKPTVSAAKVIYYQKNYYKFKA